MEILLILLALYVFRDYIAFIVLALPLRAFNSRMRIAPAVELPAGQCKMGGVDNDELQAQHVELVAQKKESCTQKIKNQIFIFFIGYERYLIHRIKMFPCHAVRNWVYRHVYLVDKHKASTIYFGCEIRSGVNLHIGKGSIVGDNCILDARQGIYIGENVNLSSEVHLWTEAHDVNDPYFRSMPRNHGPIHVGNRAWLGSNVTVLDNVKIGEGAVVCSGAVVTKDVEPFTIVAGIPAKKIGERNRNLKYEFTGSHTSFY